MSCSKPTSPNILGVVNINFLTPQETHTTSTNQAYEIITLEPYGSTLTP